jgi:hypothetical protein
MSAFAAPLGEYQGMTATAGLRYLLSGSRGKRVGGRADTAHTVAVTAGRRADQARHQQCPGVYAGQIAGDQFR